MGYYLNLKINKLSNNEMVAMVQNEVSVFDFTSHFGISLGKARKPVCSSVKVSCNTTDTVRA